MTTTFTKNWSPEGETVTVDKWDNSDLLHPSVFNHADLSVVHALVTFTVANGQATYEITGWDEAKECLKIRKIAELGQVTQSATAGSPSGHA